MAAPTAPPGHFVILYFASAASFTKLNYEHVAAPIKVGDLYQRLEELHPGIRQKILSSCALTVNLDYVDVDEDSDEGGRRVIVSGDEVALIPPVSSG